MERKKGGEFVARPVFDRKVVDLFYAVRDADTGDWISAMYRFNGGEKKRSDGWEYSWEYPALDGASPGQHLWHRTRHGSDSPDYRWE